MKTVFVRIVICCAVTAVFGAGSAVVQAQQPPTRQEQQARPPAMPESPQQAVRAGAEIVVAAPVTRLVKFSGVLRDASGQPRTGLVGITFAIYADQFEGSPLWMETHNVTLDADGRYSVLLGATKAAGIPLELFSTGETRWLGIEPNEPQGRLEAGDTPRVLLVSVPYALKAADADTLGGLPASAFLRAEEREQFVTKFTTESAAKTSEGTDAVVVGGTQAAVEGTGTTNFLAKFTGSNTIGDSVLFESAGRIGLGNTNPLAPLHVGAGLGQSNVVVDGLATSWSGYRLDHASVERWFVGFDASLGDGNLQIRSDASTNLVTITSSGRVGIGTTNPLAPLTVGAGGGQSNVVVNGQATTWSGFRLDNGSSETWFLGFDATLGEGNLQLRSDASANRMTFTRSGNVGIGTTSPAEKLDVVGTVKATSFSGSGAGLTNLPAASLTGGIVVQSNATSPNIIGGFSGNTVTANVAGAVISGGGEAALSSNNRITDDFGAIGGGSNNQAGNGDGTTTNRRHATVGGGRSNTASGTASTIAGGDNNSTSGAQATVGGGLLNTASGDQSTVGGGQSNQASGNTSVIAGGISNAAAGSSATVPGGDSNSAAGDFSFAAGRRAKVLAGHSGTFVWGDSTAADVTSSAANQFLIRAAGGFFMRNASTQVFSIDGNGNVAGTSFAGSGASLTNVTASGLAAGTYANQFNFSNAANTISGIFSGNGANLTNVNAADLTCTGCVGDSDLGVNYAGSSSKGGAATNANALGGVAAANHLVRAITYLAGCDGCSTLDATNDDQKTIYVNVIGPMTITEVFCFSDAGTPSIQIHRNVSGTPAEILTDPLQCSTSGESTTVFESGINALSVGHRLDFDLTDASTAKRVTVIIKAVLTAP
jgi:hypothetical protein